MLTKRVELLRIHREPPLGKLVIEVKGRQYRDLAAIDDAAVRGLLLAAAGDLVAFAGGYEALIEAGMAPPVAGRAPHPTATRTIRPISPTTTAAALPPISTAVDPLPSNAADPNSLVGQIDAILQRLLLARPEFSGRTIQLRQGLKGGLRIEVDGRLYEQPGQINDSAVQQLLREALQIWEAG